MNYTTFWLLISVFLSLSVCPCNQQGGWCFRQSLCTRTLCLWWYSIYRVSVLGTSKRQRHPWEWGWLGVLLFWKEWLQIAEDSPSGLHLCGVPGLPRAREKVQRTVEFLFSHDARTEGGFSRSRLCLFQVCLLLTTASVNWSLVGLFFFLLLIPWKGEWACVYFPDSWILNYLGWHSLWDSINYWGFQYFKICTTLGWLFFWLILEETHIYGLESEHSFQSCSTYDRSVLP